eukprot:m.12796 g.12796  ORF g.12796 m.12796 type:complete len:341 (-) comp4359_c1_seq1:59-1081(-)
MASYTRLAFVGLAILVLLSCADVDAARRRRRRRRRSSRPAPAPIQQTMPVQPKGGLVPQTPIDASLYYNPHPYLKSVFNETAEGLNITCEDSNPCASDAVGTCVVSRRVDVIDAILPQHGGMPTSEMTDHLERQAGYKGSKRSKKAKKVEMHAGNADMNLPAHHGPNGPYYPAKDFVALCQCKLGFVGEDCSQDVSASVYFKETVEEARLAPQKKRKGRKSRKAKKRAAKKAATAFGNRSPLGSETVADFLADQESLMLNGFLYVKGSQPTPINPDPLFPAAPIGNPQGLPQGFPASFPNADGDLGSQTLSWPSGASLPLVPDYNPPSLTAKSAYYYHKN